MNIEAYDAESLRKLVRLLEYENRLLKDKLKRENIPYEEVNPFEETIDNVEEYDPDQGERIINPTYITEEMATHFFPCFGDGRMFTQSEVKMAVIFRNVITDGMPDFVQNNGAKRHSVMNVKITSGHDWMLRRLLHIY